MTASFRKSSLVLGLAAALLVLPTPGARADQVIADDLIVNGGGLCVGAACADGEAFGTDTARFKAADLRLGFVDTATPGDDWRLVLNDDFTGGLSYFSVRNDSQSTAILTLMGAAPANALHVGANGDIGLGTASPLADIHILDGDAPAIRFEQDGSGGNPPQAFSLTASHDGFAVIDHAFTTVPFAIDPTTASNAFRLTDDGVALGLTAPLAGLHMERADERARIRVEENNATTSPRDLIRLYNNGRPEIVMGNKSTASEWSFGAGTNFVLKVGGLNSLSASKTKHLTLYGATGDLEITGQIVTGGPTCGSGCDAVFSQDYDLPSITDHAAQMFALGHLPNVGPTRPGEPLNLTDHVGRLLNELEHAHIYIARQQAEIASLHANGADTRARMARLEAELRDLQAALK